MIRSQYLKNKAKLDLIKGFRFHASLKFVLQFKFYQSDLGNLYPVITGWHTILKTLLEQRESFRMQYAAV